MRPCTEGKESFYVSKDILTGVEQMRDEWTDQINTGAIELFPIRYIIGDLYALPIHITSVRNGSLLTTGHL